MSYWLSNENFVTRATVTVSSTAAGQIGHPLKLGSGAAAAVTGGQYVGPERSYTVEIDSLSGGSEVGQASFRWRTSDSDGIWEETGRVTAESLIDLSDGVRLRWMGGAGQDFFVGDQWSFWAASPFGPSNLYDLNRDTVWRSAGLDGPCWIGLDLGRAERVTAVCLMDHNLTDMASLTLEGSTDGNWVEPAYSAGLTVSRPHAGLFMDQTFRYWRLVIDDSGNEDGRVEAAEFFLGDGFNPEMIMVDGPRKQIDAVNIGYLPREITRAEFIAPTGRAMEEIRDWFSRLTACQRREEAFFLFCPDAGAVAPEIQLATMEKRILDFTQAGQDHYRFQLNLIEAAKSYV